MSVRVLICGGGTGGHIYPALQVSRSLSAVLMERERAFSPPGVRDERGRRGVDHHALSSSPRCASDQTEVSARYLYIGACTALDRRIVAEAGLPFVGLAVGGIRGKDPLTTLR